MDGRWGFGGHVLMVDRACVSLSLLSFPSQGGLFFFPFWWNVCSFLLARRFSPGGQIYRYGDGEALDGIFFPTEETGLLWNLTGRKV